MAAGSPSKNSPSAAPAFSGGVGELAAAVNAWAEAGRVFPVSGQASREVSVRNLRYYRSLALLDGPVEGGGYGSKHFLQVAAIRLLQARGLPLARIRDLLYGRSEKDLEVIFREGVDEGHQPPQPAPPLPGGGRFTILNLPGGFSMLVPDGKALTAEQVDQLSRCLSPTAR